MNRQMLIYYAILLTVMCSWSDTVNAPPLFFRLLFLSSFFAPLFLKWRRFLTPLFICFTTLATHGYTCTYLPTEYYYYLSILIVMCMLTPQKSTHNCGAILVLLVIMLIYTTIIDIIGSFNIYKINYCFSISVLLLRFVNVKFDDKHVYDMLFCVITLVLCIFYYTVGESYKVEILGQDRVMWKDPNYMGIVAGVGVVVAFFNILNENISSKLRLFYVCTLLGGVLMMLANASRGAALCSILAMSIVVGCSKIAAKVKVLVVIASILCIFILYFSDLFEPLIQRVETDDGTGNARTTIWAIKLGCYEQGSILQQVFGVGNYNGLMLGTNGYGFHNDYVAFLLDYGVVGLLLFIILLLCPLMAANRRSPVFSLILALTVYVLVCCMTLEPFSAGRLAYYCIYLYIAYLSGYSKSKISYK